MRVCLLDSASNACVNILELDTLDDLGELDAGLVMADSDAGEIGLVWDGLNWVNPVNTAIVNYFFGSSYDGSPGYIPNLATSTYVTATISDTLATMFTTADYDSGNESGSGSTFAVDLDSGDESGAGSNFTFDVVDAG